MTARPRNCGFTLLELSIVVAIVALVTGMAVQSGISAVANARQAATQKKMGAIEQALKAYRGANDRLPCPASLTLAPGNANFGIEGANPGSCTGGTPAANYSAAGVTNTWNTAAEGTVPTTTLGLPSDLMFDGWGNRFRYAVDVSMTATGAFAIKNAGCVDGAITVKDMNGNTRSNGATYAIVSHGPNGHGAYTTNGSVSSSGSNSADELTNCHCTNTGAYNGSYAPTYVQRTPAYDAGHVGSGLYYFDDLVSYKERWQMQAAWDKTGGCSRIYVADANNNRVQVFNLSGTWVGSIGGTSSACTNCMCTGPSACPTSSGSGNGQLSNPQGVKVDSSGNIWVADVYNDRVVEFSSSGTFLQKFSANANGLGGLLYDLALDSGGNVWVSDWYQNRVLKYSSSGTFLLGIGAGYQGVSGSIGGTGSANGQFYNQPMGLAVDSANNIWVVDVGNNRVQKFSNSGTWLLSIGGPSPYTCETSPAGSPPACASGSGNGQFGSGNAVGIAVDFGGNVWVSEYSNPHRIQEFNNSGTYLSQFDTWTGGTGAANYSPGGIAVDPSGNFWVVDMTNSVIDEFNSSGTYLRRIGTSGTGNGQFQLGAFGIAISSR